MIEQGKILEELTYEIDVQRKALRTIFDDKACICWQEDGTLAYFDYEVGYPYVYYDESMDRDDFTSLSSFIKLIKQPNEYVDEHEAFLLNSPVWCTIEDHTEAERAAFNALLGDIDIQL